jgi:heme/copper-type cytochrome/quinol oxidase subunit 2
VLSQKYGLIAQLVKCGQGLSMLFTIRQTIRVWLSLSLIAALYLLTGIKAAAASVVFGQEIGGLRLISFYGCCVIGLLVFMVLLYALMRQRRCQNANIPHFHRHLITEIVWTLIPFIILIALVLPAIKVVLPQHNLQVNHHGLNRSDITQDLTRKLEVSKLD